LGEKLISEGGILLQAGAEFEPSTKSFRSLLPRNQKLVFNGLHGAEKQTDRIHQTEAVIALDDRYSLIDSPGLLILNGSAELVQLGLHELAQAAYGLFLLRV
jgi:hypothetical protein